MILKSKILKIKQNTKEIGAFWFKNDKSLNRVSEVIFPNGLIKIGWAAFAHHNIKIVKFPKSLKIIEKEAFTHNKIKDLRIPGNVKKIEYSAFFHNDIHTLKIEEGVEIIESYAFSNNKIQELILPSSLKRILFSAFQNNKIKKLKIPDNILKIENKTFSENEIEELELPNNLNVIGKLSFSCNKIKILKVPSKVEIIETGAFSKNELELLELSEGLQYIQSSAFSKNKIQNLKLPQTLKFIGHSAFEENQIEGCIILPPNLETISNSMFANNMIEEVIFNDKITEIGSSAFWHNKIKKLNLPKTLTKICSHAFAKNELESVDFTDSLLCIESSAFSNNKLTEINLPNNLEVIGNMAFSKNQLEYVKIPDSVISIGNMAFDNNVTIEYKGHIYDTEFLDDFGCNLIVKVSQILEIVPTFDFKSISRNILNIIPLENDSLKGYMTNYKKFDNLVKEIEIMELNSEEYIDIYKLCYLLGLFHTGGNEQLKIIKIIMKMVELHNLNGIHTMFTDIELTKYKQRFQQIIMSEYDNPLLDKVIAKLYNECEEITNCIIKGRKETIGILVSQNRNNPSVELEKKIEYLKNKKNKITIQDVYDYITDHLFDIKSQNERLKEIAPILSTFLTQSQFDEIQTLYEQSKTINKKIYNYLEGKGEYYYKWLSGDDPLNIVLGYLCNCCAKYSGAGMDIMVQGMINPCVKNLVVYDGKNNIIGKSTAFYNQDKKYILFNNIEMSKSFLSNKEVENKKRKVLKAFLEGIKEQVYMMQKNNYLVEEVRIGMLRNDLEEEIIKSNIPIVHKDLLDNYPYKNYSGDANNKEKGQAIIKIK